MIIKLKKFTETAIVPKYAMPGDAGADLYADTSVMLRPGKRQLVGTGLGIEIPFGYVGLVHPRSSFANKYGVTVANSPGTIDAGYRGEIRVNLINLSDSLVTFDRDTKVAQLIIQKVENAEFVIVDELEDSERGQGGHGSTGMI
jgi:dUTP pyrophosphatase